MREEECNLDEQELTSFAVHAGELLCTFACVFVVSIYALRLIQTGASFALIDLCKKIRVTFDRYAINCN